MEGNEAFDKRAVKEEVVVKSILPKIFIMNSKEILVAVLIGVMITVFSAVILNFLFPEIEEETSSMEFQPPIEISEPNHREYFVRTGLANIMASLTPIKAQIHMYFQMTGEFPKKAEDINISAFDFEEHENINSTFMTDNSGIGVYLSKNFGDERFLVLQPSTSKNGAFIKWTCITNVDEKYLGIPKNRMCEFKDSM